MQNFRKIQWIVIDNSWNGRTDRRMDGRTRVNSKVPIPTKVGGPKRVPLYERHFHYGSNASDPVAKQVTDKVSGIKTCKFGSGTIKNHYNVICGHISGKTLDIFERDNSTQFSFCPFQNSGKNFNSFTGAYFRGGEFSVHFSGEILPFSSKKVPVL